MVTKQIELLIWQPSYSINNEILDQEHKKIMNCINEIYTVHMQNNMPLALEKFSELIYMTTAHFAHEESIFSKCLDSHHLTEHKTVHKYLLKQLSEFYFDSYKKKIISEDILKFLRIWFESDVIGADKLDLEKHLKSTQQAAQRAS